MRHSNIANEKKSTQGHVPHSSTILDHDIQTYAGWYAQNN